MSRIDLHVHYKRRKRDEDGFPHEMCEAAQRNGLAAIAFTEHEQHLWPADIEGLADEFSIRVYLGMEVRCYSHDLLVYGEEMPDVSGGDAQRVEAIARSREAGSLAVILAHPFRKGHPIHPAIEDFPLDGIEIASNNTPPSAIPQIFDFARSRGLGLWVNSDAHKTRQIGGHWNAADELPESNQALVDWIKGRRRDFDWDLT